MLLPDPIRNTSHVRPSPGGREAGFSLVEACMAIGLVAFCLVALLGLFQIGLSQERQAVDQVRATHILAAVSDEFRGLGRLPDGSSSTQTQGVRYKLQLPSSGASVLQPSASLKVDEQGEIATANEAYVIHYWITPPSITQGIYAPYKLRVIVAWPGSASIKGAVEAPELKNIRGYVETTLEFNRG